MAGETIEVGVVHEKDLKTARPPLKEFGFGDVFLANTGKKGKT